MAGSGCDVEYVYLEDGETSDEDEKMQKLLEIVKNDVEGFEDNKNFQKTLIFTNDDSTASKLACRFYIQFKSKPLLFALDQFESPTPEEHEKNEKLVARFNKSSKIIGITNFTVQEKTNFSFAKHFIFYDFPVDSNKFLVVSKTIGVGAKKCQLNGKITVFEAGMSSVQKVTFVHALANAGKSIPKSLEQFVINDRNLSDNATVNLRELKMKDEVKNGRSDAARLPQPIQAQQQPVRETPKINATAANNRNGSYMTVDGVEYKVNRNQHLRPDMKQCNNNCNPEKLIMIAKDLSFGDFNGKLTKEDFDFFHELSPNEKSAFNNSVSEEAWDEILKTDKAINQFRHESKKTLTNAGTRELIEDFEKQINAQQNSWDNHNHRRIVMLIRFKETHILSMNNDEIVKACLFCNSHDHFSLLCVYYPTFEMRQFRCKERGICHCCGGMLRNGFDHRCPRDLECHGCGASGHVKAIGHDHPDW